MVATSAVAVMKPMPGLVSRRRLAAFPGARPAGESRSGGSVRLAARCDQPDDEREDLPGQVRQISMALIQEVNQLLHMGMPLSGR